MHYVTYVKPLPDYVVEVTFDDGKTKLVDMKKRLNKGIFSQLKNVNVFDSVYVSIGGTIEWRGEIDVCPDTLYAEGIEVAPGSQEHFKYGSTTAP